jgi:hypothetical protein
MASTPIYDGAAQVKVAIPGVASGALQELGYGEDGIEIVRTAFWANVHGDQNGGTEGPPIDVQFLGEIATIRMVLTKFDITVATAVACRTAAGTSGTPAAAGTLMFEESKAMRLLINTPNRPINFPRAFVRGTNEINKAVKFQKFILEWECHKDANGVLFNATTT